MTVLYLAEQGCVLKKTGKRFIVSKDKKNLLDIPSIKVKQIVVFGNCQLTTQVISFCLSEGVDLVYLTQSGRFKGRLQSDYSKDVKVRQAQFLMARKEKFCLSVALNIVVGKITNSLQLCHQNKSFFSGKKVKNGIKQLEEYKDKIKDGVPSFDYLRGIEGRSAVVHFEILRDYFKHDLGFKKRIKHPPPDPINILLSLGYTLLYNNVFAMIHLVGMDPYQGFYHTDKHGHASLASDLMEEFRAIVVDRAVLRLINLKVITKKDFENKEKSMKLTSPGFKKFVTAYNDSIERVVWHKKEKKHLSLLQCVEYQTRHFARVIAGKEKAYKFLETE